MACMLTPQPGACAQGKEARCLAAQSASHGNMPGTSTGIAAATLAEPFQSAALLSQIDKVHLGICSVDVYRHGGKKAVSLDANAGP